ncbi:MAG: flavodoxin [Clostridiales bacterium]|mgnify:CR=1 FL=1|nr:flavodoxin [Clostridiales bacterium]
MKRIAVIYQSKHGATKRYAQWLAEALDADLYENKRLKPRDLAAYEAIILAGGLFATGIKGISFLRDNAAALPGKRLYCLGVGASPAEPEVVEELKKNNAKGALADVAFFYARGAWDVQAMTPIDRAMCSMLYKSLRKKEPRELPLWAKALVDCWDQKNDWTDRANLMPLINRVLKDSQPQ